MFFLYSVFLILFQVTVSTTTPPVTVVCSRTSPTTVTVRMAPTSVDSVASGLHDVVVPPQLILRNTGGSVDLTTVLQQKQYKSQMPSQAYANYAMGTLQVSFLIQS